jgi:hypothetical protein
VLLPAPSRPAALAVEDLACRFGRVQALAGVSLAVRPREVGEEGVVLEHQPDAARLGRHARPRPGDEAPVGAAG